MELRSVVLIFLAISLCYVDFTETLAVNLPAQGTKKTPCPGDRAEHNFTRLVFLLLGGSLIIGVVIAFIQCWCIYHTHWHWQELAELEQVITHKPVNLPAPGTRKTSCPGDRAEHNFTRLVFLLLGGSLIFGVVIEFIQWWYIYHTQWHWQEPAELEEVITHKPVVPEAVMELGNIPDMGIMDSIQVGEENIIEETPLINEKKLKKGEDVTKKKSGLKRLRKWLKKKRDKRKNRGKRIV
ncbi:uncharacterized protein LOC142665977 [Rhinoderma darwinii]|uniref:uncharacterized protein LOC142665977 n=1 Tax=Rhinoderma darwinii TaxID=43563 RepID=UPI003F668E5E